MKDKTNKRWIVVGIIWAVVIFLTCRNINTMDRVRSPAERIEISRNERQFLQYNSENISRVLKKRALFHQPVESLKLGLLSVENQLQGLVAKYDLKEFRTECHPSKASQGSMPVRLSFQGSFERTLKLMGVLQKDYPYLLIKQVKITPHQLEHNAEFNILFDYRYRVSSGESRI
jgi:hypothetical protein